MSNTTPENNGKIAQQYDVKNLAKKVKNKTDLQQELGWPAEPKRPMLCLPLGMTDELGGALFEELLPGLSTLPLEILVLGKGSEKYGKLFTKLANEKGHRLHIVENNPESIAKMLAASDMALFLHDPSDDQMLTACLQFGVVPIVPEGTNIDSYDPIQESGCSFSYTDASVWHSFGAIVRALESYRFPYDWRTIQKHCMEKNN